jgi:serine/threonine protein kinase
MPDAIEHLTAALGGKYQVERELGVGGMATVYLARDVKHDRPVALKVLHPDLSISLGAERFLREIRIVAKMQHPHILGLIDSGEADGMLYYVMPYVAGESLRTRLARDGELPVHEAAWILREVADALAYAHGKQVVHRDIKPENVLFAERHAQVADFGIARAVSEAAMGTPITATGIAVGSPAYMAPEQAQSDPQMDHRADIYAFGVMAYELLTGVAPFTAPTAVQLVAAHLTRAPDPPSRLRPLLPEALDQIVLRCLAKRPADRFQSAEEIVLRLEALLSGPLSSDLVTTKEHAVAPSQFRISEGLCRRLSRDSFDPRMVGDSLEYLDNHARSDVLVCLLPAVGLDATEWEAHLRSLPYRAVSVTLYGFEPARRRRPTLPLSDHVVLLREFLRFIVDRTRPRTLVLGGFSSGGDLALRLAGGRAVARVDAVLSLGCNLSLETCFVTRILAAIDTRDPSRLLDGLRTVGSHTSALDAWVTVHKYLVQMLQKFQTQVEPLRRAARDIVAPFEGAGASPFIQWYRDAAEQAHVIRCVFEDDAIYPPLVQDLLARHAAAGILGPRFREGSLVVEPGTHHFDLESPELVSRHLESIMAELVSAAATRGEEAAAL